VTIMESTLWWISSFWGPAAMPRHFIHSIKFYAILWNILWHFIHLLHIIYLVCCFAIFTHWFHVCSEISVAFVLPNREQL
jgi:hypothetical protein